MHCIHGSFTCVLLKTLPQVDHKAKEIIPKADLPSPRKEFSACAIGCKVYVTGGRGSENGVSKDVWIYDTVHEEWSKGAPMLIAR